MTRFRVPYLLQTVDLLQQRDPSLLIPRKHNCQSRETFSLSVLAHDKRHMAFTVLVSWWLWSWSCVKRPERIWATWSPVACFWARMPRNSMYLFTSCGVGLLRIFPSGKQHVNNTRSGSCWIVESKTVWYPRGRRTSEPAARPHCMMPLQHPSSRTIWATCAKWTEGFIEINQNAY